MGGMAVEMDFAFMWKYVSIQVLRKEKGKRKNNASSCLYVLPATSRAALRQILFSKIQVFRKRLSPQRPTKTLL